MNRVEPLIPELQFIASILDHMEELVSITDQMGRYLIVNKTFSTFYSQKPESFLGKTDQNFRSDDEVQDYCRYDQEVLTQGKSILFEFQVQVEVQCKYLEVSKKPLYNQTGSVIGILAVSRDITERKEMNRRLKLSEEKYAKAFQLSPDAIALTRFRDGLYLEVSQGFTKISGYEENELVGKTAFERDIWVDVSDRMRMLQGLQKTGEVLDLEAKFRTKDGAIIIALMSSKLIEVNGELCIISYSRNITERKKTEEYLTYLSQHDTLTGLYNRDYFRLLPYRLQKEGKNRVGLLLFDIDGLKMINNTLGQAAGDERLLAVKRILQKKLGDQAILARIGGDEFAAIIPEGTAVQMEHLMSQIDQESKKERLVSHIVPLTISSGYALGDLNLKDFQAIYKEADDNMQRQKLLHGQSNRNILVKTIAELLKARDFGTEEHADRLQDIICYLARSYGYSEQKLGDLKLLAQFHDIGKIGIPDAILNKPGRLTNEEMTEMKRHTQIGYQIAQVIPEIALIADWILKHHEWWNGSGYPLGLKGEEIPVECRMLSVCDAYDAMTSDRPYRRALDHEVALAELVRFKGIQFDPDLVELFVCQSKRGVL